MGGAPSQYPTEAYPNLQTNFSGQAVIQSAIDRSNTTSRSPWPCVFADLNLTGRGQELPATRNNPKITLLNQNDGDDNIWWEQYDATNNTDVSTGGVVRGLIGFKHKSVYIPANITCKYSTAQLNDNEYVTLHGPSTIANSSDIIVMHFYWTPADININDTSPIIDEHSWIFFQCAGLVQTYQGKELGYWKPQTASCDNWMEYECKNRTSGAIYPTQKSCNCINSDIATKMQPVARYTIPVVELIDDRNVDLSDSKVSLNDGDRVILNSQDLATENGIYVVSGDTLSRAPELKVDADIRSTGVVKVGDDWWELESNGPFESETAFTAVVVFRPHFHIQPLVTCLDNECAKNGYRTSEMSTEKCDLTFCQSAVTTATSDSFLSSNQTLFCGDHHYDISIPGDQSSVSQQNITYNYEEVPIISQGIWIGIYVGIIVLAIAFILFRVFTRKKK